jgi:hypothetical protein
MAGITLYEIDGMLREALELSESEVNYETGEINETWSRFLDELQMEKDKKCLAIGAVIRELIIESDAVATEYKRLQKRERAICNKIAKLKIYLQSVMTVGEKLKDNRITLSWHTTHAVNVFDENSLPEYFFKTEKAPMKLAIKSAIESGKDVPGAELITNKSIVVK